MKTKLKIIIPIIVAIAAVIIAAVCIKFNTNESYSLEAVMSTAQQYLTEQKYEQAIAEFEKAIQIDPRDVDAYIGIAQAYELIGDTEKALEWLQKGFDITGDPALKAEIDRLGGSAEVEVTEQTTEETTTTPPEETTSAETAVSYSNEELTKVLNQLIENPDAEIEQDKLDAIKYVNIIGQDFIYAGSDNYIFFDGVYTLDDRKTYYVFVNGIPEEHSYGEIKNLSFLSKLKNIVSVEINGNLLADISALSNLPNLKYLNLDTNLLTDISALGNLTNLKKLSLSYNQISDISALSNLTSIADLDLSDNQISNISALSNLTNLNYLSLSDNQISEIVALNNLINLDELVLYENQINDISALSNLINLKTLWLYKNQINDISALSNLTKLTNVYLRYNKISDISALSNLTNLEDLDLQYNQISDISTLNNLTNLKILYLNDNHISQEEMNKIKKALPNCTVQD